MPTPQQIIDLIDAGTGRAASTGMGPIDQTQCGRVGCKQQPEAGHDFCTACLAWLRFETDDDPLGDSQPPPVLVETAYADLWADDDPLGGAP